MAGSGSLLGGRLHDQDFLASLTSSLGSSTLGSAQRQTPSWGAMLSFEAEEWQKGVSIFLCHSFQLLPPAPLLLQARNAVQTGPRQMWGERPSGEQ